MACGDAIVLELPQDSKPDECCGECCEEVVLDAQGAEDVVELADNFAGPLVLLCAGKGLCAHKGLARDHRKHIECFLHEKTVVDAYTESMTASSARSNGLTLPNLYVIAPAGHTIRYIENRLAGPRHSIKNARCAASRTLSKNVSADHCAVGVCADVAFVDDEEDGQVVEKGLPNLGLEGLDAGARPVDDVPDDVHLLACGPAEEVLGARDEGLGVPLLQAFAVVDHYGKPRWLVALEVGRHGLPCTFLSDFLAKNGVDE